VSAATQIYYASFDAVFVKLPLALRQGLEAAAPQLDSDVQLGNYAFDPCIVSRL